MIKAIIVDDEIKCIESLSQILEENCRQVAILEKCNSAKEGLMAIKRLQPDLVFLDIEMPWMNGFEMLEMFDEINFNVIFTTAYDKFAVKAFRISAIDYLLKPVDPDELIGAINKLENQRLSGISQEQFDVLIDNIKLKTPVKRVALPVGNGFNFVPVDQIMYIEADGSYTNVFLEDGKKLCVVRRLNQMASLLEGNSFCRIHNSHLINLDHAKKYVRGDGGYVIMDDGANLPVSRNRKKALMSRIGS